MVAFLQAHWFQIAAAIGGLALIVWQFWPALSKLRLPSIGGATVATEDDDVLDLHAMRRLAKRYENCPEGKAAVQVLYAHFFHQHEAHP